MIRGDVMLPVLGMVALAAGGILGGIAPVVHQRQALKEKIGSLHEDLAKPFDEPGMIGALNAEIADLKRLGESRTTPIPKEDDIAGLVRDLSRKLQDLGLSRNEVTMGATQAGDDASSIPLALHVEGRFIPVMNAAAYVESLPRLVRIHRLALSNPAATRSPGVEESVEADLMLDVFFAPTGGAAQAAGAAQGKTP